jgi:hypothetical protein
MTNLANPYFNKTPLNEQNLLQGYVTELIQVVGHGVYYLPRKIQNLDLVLGEDVVSKFDDYIEIEAIIDTYEGWQGQSELISKFGLEIRNQIVYKISVTRWNEEIAKIPTIAEQMIVSKRPQEGDLIYDTVTKMLFEIKFIDQDWQFSTLGKKTYAFKLTTEMYQYSNDIADTGITELDTMINDITNNLSDLELLLEDGTRLLQESGSSIFVDEVYSEPRVFDTTREFNLDADIINFNVNNPFNDLI